MRKVVLQRLNVEDLNWVAATWLVMLIVLLWFEVKI